MENVGVKRTSSSEKHILELLVKIEAFRKKRKSDYNRTSIQRLVIHSSMTQKRQTYQERAEHLAQAIEIAEKVIREFGLEERRADEQMIQWGKEVKNHALNPEPAFKTIASLKYLINDFFVYWNEAAGEAIEAFWKEIYSTRLPFERKDVISDILKRGKIRNIPEYEVVTDSLVVMEQIGKITAEQAKDLSKYLGEFEDKQVNKKG